MEYFVSLAMHLSEAIAPHQAILSTNMGKFLAACLLKFIAREKRCTLFDIDNTLADAWPSYLKPYSSHYERLINLVPFPSMINLVKEKYAQDEAVFFISARGLRTYWVTKRWLEAQGIFRWNLFLVRTPQEKVKLVKMASKLFRKIELYDDLSYNHENGEIKFYEDCIQELLRIPNLVYHGYSELLLLQRVEK